MLSQSIGTALLEVQSLLAQSLVLATNSTSQIGCTPPTELQRLFDFLNSLTELAFLGGATLATLTFVVAGICILIPGGDYTRLGKQIAKNGFAGALILLSADMVVAYLISQLGGAVC